MYGADNADISIVLCAYTKRARGPGFSEIVIDGLEHTEEQQADADPGGKHHRNPAGIGIVGFGILAADPDLADGMKDQNQTEQGDGINGQHKKPVKGAGQPGAQPAEEGCGRVLVGKRN